MAKVNAMQQRIMSAAMDAVVQERQRQIEKWGGHAGDGVENPSKPNGDRLRVLAEEFGEVAEAMGRVEDGNGKGDLRTELVQVAAVAVAWVEAIDWQRYGKLGLMPPEPIRDWRVPTYPREG